jgi:hypothetical protein
MSPARILRPAAPRIAGDLLCGFPGRGRELLMGAARALAALRVRATDRR